MRLPRLGSLFAGIGGFDLGFERAGFETVWQCEYDEAARSVLRKHFPKSKLLADIRDVSAIDLDQVDVITFGSPCQDMSVAGKRAGLSGERSVLFYEAIRIIRECRERGIGPRFAVWENVVGALSSNQGRDFACVLQAFLDCGAVDICWRVLDSAGAGVAQRRRRIFAVADFDNTGGAAQVLLEPESSERPLEKGRGKDASAFARGAATSSGVECLDHGCDWDECGCWCVEDAECPWCGQWTSGLAEPVEVNGLDCCAAWFRRLCGTLSDGAHMGGGNNGQDIVSGRIIVDNRGRPRRLTPVECERLQGFPDEWTGGQRDGHRFRQLGNAVTVNVAEWIARRIVRELRGDLWRCSDERR